MGNTCRGKVKAKENEHPLAETFKARSPLDGDVLGDGVVSPVLLWEQRQMELNEVVMEKMREEFTNRPDNFILNLLIASVQFYANYNKEKVEIKNYIQDRELAFNRKLENSKRKLLFMGGHEEISGTHMLYQPRGQPYMEMPTPLQFYIVHDNVELYPEYEYEELQKRQYADLDGPGYRFATEYSKRHPGYVRLRCVDIIPGVTRSNTYEDIYGFLRPLDESEPDPMMDPRPRRRASLTADMPNGDMPHGRPSLTSFEESDDEEARSPILNGPNRPANINMRRPSGVLPNGYPSSAQLGQLIGAMRALAKASEGRDAVPNGDVDDEERPRRGSLSERRPSGLFPRVGPEMRRLRLTSTHDTTDARAMMARRLTLVEEEEEEEEEDSEEEEEQSNPSEQYGLNPGEALEVVGEEGEETQGEGSEKQEPVILHARLNEGCFINRNIKIKDPQDAYGISTKTERRTYFSSERHMECFEEDFDDLVKVLSKEHLQDTSQRQGVAVTANELMIEEIGPKFYTEFIPSLTLNEWPNCAFEWKMRERRGKLDQESKIMYKWPKDITVQEAAAMGCNIVPMGHYNPKEPNRVMKIEWQIQFVKAEQILLRSLGHTQMRLLLWIEYLLWDHLGDVPGIKNQHLRYILFWMCEKNFRDWQEPRLGIKLKAYLKTLYNSLSSESLPHYFIMSCNMMENIPEKYIRQTQATVKKIKENLPLYVMHTMSRMRMASDFYPRLNVKKLFKLVTMESFGVAMLNPQLLTLTGGGDTGKDGDEDEFYRSESEDEEGDMEEKRRLHEMRLERKRKLAEANRKGNINDNNNNRDTGSRQPPTIRLDAKIKRVKDLRAGPVLKLFGRHFLAMARASNRHRAYPQAYAYLLLARNMATLLDETANNDDARKLRKQVEELNAASRGGVRDMLGTSWSVNEQHDLVPNVTMSRGTNWELGKASPQPPQEQDSMFGMNQRQTITSLQDLGSHFPDGPMKPPLSPQDSDINELPLDTPTSSLPASPFLPHTHTDPKPLPVEPLSALDEPEPASGTDTVDNTPHTHDEPHTITTVSLAPIEEESESPSHTSTISSLSSIEEEQTSTLSSNSDGTPAPEEEVPRSPSPSGTINSSASIDEELMSAARCSSDDSQAFSQEPSPSPSIEQSQHETVFPSHSTSDEAPAPMEREPVLASPSTSDTSESASTHDDAESHTSNHDEPATSRTHSLTPAHEEDTLASRKGSSVSSKATTANNDVLDNAIPQSLDAYDFLDSYDDESDDDDETTHL